MIYSFTTYIKLICIDKNLETYPKSMDFAHKFSVQIRNVEFSNLSNESTNNKVEYITVFELFINCS